MQLYWSDWGSPAQMWVALWHIQPQALGLLWVLRAGTSVGVSWLGAPGWALCATAEVRGTEPCCPRASRRQRQALHLQPLPWTQTGLASQPRPWALDPALVLSSAALQAPPQSP